LQQIDNPAGRQRFIADAAHELRTPLAILRIHAQNAQLAAPQQREEALEYLVRCGGSGDAHRQSITDHGAHRTAPANRHPPWI
jgi:signal transduction histidine kinase